MASKGVFIAKVVTGLDANGTMYDEMSMIPYSTLEGAATDVAQYTLGCTWDIFNPENVRVARVHVDGGIDQVT